MNKFCDLTSTNRELVPVDHRTFSALRDRKCSSYTLKPSCTCHNLLTHWIRLNHTCPKQRDSPQCTDPDPYNRKALFPETADTPIKTIKDTPKKQFTTDTEERRHSHDLTLHSVVRCQLSPVFYGFLFTIKANELGVFPATRRIFFCVRSDPIGIWPVK